jgi:hypothetical protein
MTVWHLLRRWKGCFLRGGEGMLLIIFFSFGPLMGESYGFVVLHIFILSTLEEKFLVIF